MRRFRFRLASYERLLAHREEDARLRAAQAAAEQRAAADLLSRIRGLASAALSEQRQRRAEKPLPPHEEQLYEVYFDGMSRAAAYQQERADRAAERLDARRRALREAATRHRALGLLRERRLAGHREAAARELTRILDEAGARPAAGPLASSRHPLAVPGGSGPDEPAPAA